MTEKAVIAYYDVERDQAQGRERSQAEDLGIPVEATLPYGTLVVANAEQRAALEAEGISVVPLFDTAILGVGTHRIDTSQIGAPPSLPAELQVPPALRESWTHHLVQLIAPPNDQWIRDIESHGVKVVEPMSRYGLFVVGPSQVVASLPQQLGFVAWAGRFEPGYRINDALLDLEGRIRFVSVGVYPSAAAPAVEAALPGLNAAKRKGFEQSQSTQRGDYATLFVEIDREQLPALACLPDVRWLEHASPEQPLAGEREVQIVAGNLDASGKPLHGYVHWLDGIALKGAGSCIAICDTGVDANGDFEPGGSGHPDFGGGRLARFVPYADAPATDTNGHGTIVASIAVGNASTNEHENDDIADFLWGLGVAPGASFVVQNALDSSIWPPTPDEMSQLARDAVTNGAHIINNSWRITGSTGYTDVASRIDRLARDADDLADGLQSLIFVSAAGNGGPNAGTIWGPHEAKNAITVGATHSKRVGFENARRLMKTSSRGPAQDGRRLPTVVAPGVNVSAARSATSGYAVHGNTGKPVGGKIVGAYTIPPTPGTSFAAPHVAGCCALILQWWRKTHDELPSPAMVKALLVNGAEDLWGGGNGDTCCLGHIPDNDQGWGRVNIRNIVLDGPGADRGPKICIDDTPAFTGAPQQQTFRVAPADESRWMRITLVWTDAPAGTGANPARVNNLDLEVHRLPDGPTYKGNRFENGHSIPDGDFQDLDNVECVYLHEPSGEYEVRVKAAFLGGNAKPPFDHTPWQDFAMVMDNAVAVP